MPRPPKPVQALSCVGQRRIMSARGSPGQKLLHIQEPVSFPRPNQFAISRLTPLARVAHGPTPHHNGAQLRTKKWGHISTFNY
jgi:hypothetical protein